MNRKSYRYVVAFTTLAALIAAGVWMFHDRIPRRNPDLSEGIEQFLQKEIRTSIRNRAAQCKASDVLTNKSALAEQVKTDVAKILEEAQIPIEIVEIKIR